MPKIQKVIETVFKVCGNVIDAIVPVIRGLMDVIGKLVAKSQESGTFINKVWTHMQTCIQNSINVIMGVLDIFSALLEGDWKGLWEGVKKILASVWDTMKSLIKLALDAVIGIIKGIATALCNELETGFIKVTTHASITAKPFFLNRGYKVEKEQRVVRNGIYLTNYIMEK